MLYSFLTFLCFVFRRTSSLPHQSTLHMQVWVINAVFEHFTIMLKLLKSLPPPSFSFASLMPSRLLTKQLVWSFPHFRRALSSSTLHHTCIQCLNTHFLSFPPRPPYEPSTPTPNLVHIFIGLEWPLSPLTTHCGTSLGAPKSGHVRMLSICWTIHLPCYSSSIHWKSLEM
mgnify:FL=1